MGYTSVRKCIHIEIKTRYGVSRKTHYKWKSRYKKKGIEGLSDISRRHYNLRYCQK
ncbi:MAG: helix-turn-helix domain-containing protein [Candidatus Nitrosopolaris sp.]